MDEGSKRRFLTMEQAAEELAVGVPLVRTLLKTGELRGLQIGGRGMWRIGIQDLEAYIDQAYQRTAEKIAAGDMPDDEPELD
ncbi:helix-turn-helix DNA binding domain protein [Arthrobacter phage Shoya]|uniref:Helix-turn-helix DNA binding domain protein n=1 Tax=Arthrobacter phage Shoya TaxID=2704035 RepID=A0A6G6XIW3_9CAUD|nr:helix-turn-helix DNA binding domain protein [Arthrobacter phage Shoya]QIG57700.1 helix-turn-helix DNA binding domain protein [Arthrobacter phage Shoya]